jgi:ABC-type multidrug transport system ATPase subunit
MIQVRDVRKRYGSRAVLDGVSFDVGRGERVALVGPNGSGKTTLLRCLLGLLAYEGRIAIDGRDAIRDHAAARAEVAYVPQRAPALPVPVGDIVRFWATERRQPASALVGAAAVLGLDLGEVWARRFPALSGGMQQKLLAATALASGCPALVLDEPTANLDPRAREAFFRALAAGEPRRTVVLSSHRLEELEQLVDRVIVLDEGRIAFDDALDRLLADPDRARRAGIEPREPRVIPFRSTS